MIPLVCPNCRVELLPAGESLHCPACRTTYPVVNGVPRFVAEDPFYTNEERWSAPDRSAGGARNWLVKKQRFFVLGLTGRTGTILDLGCGGGWSLFAQGRQVAGIDVSQRSLEAARTIYRTVAAANWTRLPFPDDTFDTIVSSDVLGHVPFNEKKAVFDELYRVLKPSGRTLHYIEAEGRDPLTRWEKKWPELYERYVVQPEGHIGMECPSAIFDRFRRTGFRPVVEQGAYKMLVYVNRAVQLYDNEYSGKSQLVGLGAKAARLLMRTRVGEAVGNVGIAALLEVTDRILPTDWGSGALVEYTK